MPVRRVLVIRKHNHLGDMLCSLPLYAAIKRQWPDCSITLLAAPTSYPVPLLEINPYVDDVVLYRKDSLLSVARMQMMLRYRRYDMAIVPSTIRLSQTSHITARITGAPERIGIGAIDGVRNPGAKWLTKALDVRWGSERVHQVWRNIDVAVASNCARIDHPLPLLRIKTSESATTEAKEFTAQFPSGSTLVGVHPGAGKLENIWPVEKFASVLASLHERRPIGVIVTAGSPDEEVVARLTALLIAGGIPYRLLQDASIPTLAATIGLLHLFLSNDTGTMHVAAFSGAPVVSLFGPTPSWEWAPLQQGCTAIQSHDGTMQAISTDEVLAACESTLAGMLPTSSP